MWQELFIHTLGWPRDSWKRSSIIDVEFCGKYPSRKPPGLNPILESDLSAPALASGLEDKRGLLWGVLLPSVALPWIRMIMSGLRLALQMGHTCLLSLVSNP